MDIGIDIEEIERIKNAIEKWKRFKNRVFSDREIAYCESKRNPYPSYTARYSLKEAIIKMKGGRLSMKSIEIIKNQQGKPEAFINGRKCDNIKISISHSKLYVVCIAILDE